MTHNADTEAVPAADMSARTVREPSDRDNLQMGYNALCSALWVLDRIDTPKLVMEIAPIFQLIEHCRSRLSPIAWPTASGELD